MSDPPEVPTDWGMWEDIEGQLGKKKKNRLLPVLLGLPFIILFSGIIGYMLAPKSNGEVSLTNTKKTDTIYIKESYNTVDTVVLTKYITKWRNRNLDAEFQLKISDLALQNQSLQNSLAHLDSKLKEYRVAFSESVLNDNPKYKHLDFFEEKDKVFENQELMFDNQTLIRDLALSPTLYPQKIDYSRPHILIHKDLWLEHMIKNKKSESLLEQLVPDYVNLGISIETPGLAIRKNLSPGLESGIGIQTEFLFSPRFSLQTGIRKRATQNKTTDEVIASVYPQPIVTSEESFKNMNLKSSFIDVPLSFKYKLSKHRQNDIYLMGGLLLSKRTQTEYVYEYIRGDSEIYYEEKEDGGSWTLGSTIFGLGYEMETWRNTSAFVESYARYNFSGDPVSVHGIGFRFGMYYKI